MRTFLRLLFLACFMTGTLVPACSQVADYPVQAAERQLSVDVLSDTAGADMSPYLHDLISNLRKNWLLKLSAGEPQQKPQETLITLTLAANGKLKAVHLDSSSEDQSAGEAAWDVVKDAGYAPLPAELKAPDLKLRIHFTVK